MAKLAYTLPPKKMDKKTVAIIVAHPDDEILWAGGILIDNPKWECIILSLCRKYDIDRAPKFYKALHALNAHGAMADLDDGSTQTPQNKEEIQSILLNLLPHKNYDLIITHSPLGEYTRHLRHEEISKAVIDLWIHNRISANELLLFAYEDGNRRYFPRAIISADLHFMLPDEIWLKKYQLITKIYGFDPESWEAKTTPKAEAFWRVTNKQQAVNWLDQKIKI